MGEEQVTVVDHADAGESPSDDGAPVVLVATPDAATREVVREQLTALACRAVATEVTDDVLARCQETHPDAVLIDLSLAEGAGAVLLEGLRADPALADTTVVLLGDDVDPVVVAAGLRIGAHDYLRTPIDTAELIARVASALRMKALRDELRIQAGLPRAAAATAESAAGATQSPGEDELEGAISFRAGRAALVQLGAVSERQQTGLAAVLLDIDDLQGLNFDHGWEAGDAALAEVARRVRATVRDRDVVVRWGRDELLVLLPATQMPDAAKCAEMLVAAVRNEPVMTSDGPIRISATAGCAAVRAGETDALLADVDAALWAAKQEGPGTVALPPPAKDRPVKAGRAEAMAAAAAGGAGGGRRRGWRK
jgi:two-component system, cell cycle response regulator